MNKINKYSINLYDSSGNLVEIDENSPNAIEYKVRRIPDVVLPHTIGLGLADDTLFVLAKEGVKEKNKIKGKKYESKKYPFLCLIDSIVTKKEELKDTQAYTINSIIEKMNDPDPNEHIHCIIYCVTLNNIYEKELKLISHIR